MATTGVSARDTGLIGIVLASKVLALDALPFAAQSDMVASKAIKLVAKS